MLIQNETIKNLLQQKAEIVNDGKQLNLDIENKAQPIVSKFLLEKGLTEVGDSEDSYGDGTNFYKLYQGSFVKLQKAFNDNSLNVLQETIEKELEDNLNALKAKELQVMKLNEQMNEVLKNEIIPTLNLGETEELKQIDLKGDDIELTIVDVLEEYKKNYLEQKAKRNQDTVKV